MPLTPLQQLVRIRVHRGRNLLDAVTPGWWQSINTKTLRISNRESCVFAQATHSFEQGIVQVAQAAKAQHVSVRLLTDTIERSRWAKNGAQWRIHWWLPTPANPDTIDVDYYGFDVDDELRKLAPHTSRRAAWDALTDEWTRVIEEKQRGKNA